MQLWYQRRIIFNSKLIGSEYNKILLKSLLSNSKFNLDFKIYIGNIFRKYSKTSSSTYLSKRFCVKTGFTKSVFRCFKMVRHHCKFYASNGFLVGLRKASF